MDRGIFIRQTGIIDPDKLTHKIAIIGGGSIGGWTALCLGKLGCSNITVFDFDEVEKHNAGSQIYNTLDDGMLKTDALKLKIDFLIEGEIKVENKKWTPEIDLTTYEIVIAGVDNITDRGLIFQQLKGKKILYIDGRMASNNIELYSVHMDNPADIKFYESTLFPEEETIEVPCSERAVVYNVFCVASLMGVLISKHANGQELPKAIDVDLANLTLYK